MRRVFALSLLTLAVVAFVGMFYSARSLGTDLHPAAAAAPLSDASVAHEDSPALDWTLLGLTVCGATIMLLRPRRRHAALPAPATK
jgi:hypothetical protein